MNIIRKLLIVCIIAVILSSMISVSDESIRKDMDDISWAIYPVMSHKNIGKKFIMCCISEAPDARDGPPADGYDGPHPPMPPSPYIDGFLDDNLAYPYDKLTRDCRQYPDFYKIFNMTVFYDTSFPPILDMNNSNDSLKFEWDIEEINNIEYENIEIINTKTGEHSSILRQDEWNTTVIELEYTQFKIICDLVHIELKDKWNFISPYCTILNEKSDALIYYNDTTLNWNEALQNNIIIDAIYGWDNLNQTYLFSHSFTTGHGYWMYANHPCYLWLKNYTIPTQNKIIELNKDWNMIGSPFDTPVSKNNITIEWNNTNYTWVEGINTGLITNTFYSWNNTAQSYEISNDFKPGNAYWIYAYQPCMLKRE